VEQDLNIEIEKLIGHERLRNDAIRFLCKWDGYPNEDATYHAAEDFRTSPYGIQLVKNYVLGFGDPPEDLRAWVLRTEWIQESVLEEWEKRGKAAEDDNDGERTKRVKKRKNFLPLSGEDVGN